MNDSSQLAFAAQMKQARSLHRAGNLDRAIELYQQLYAQSPSDPQLLSLLGAATLQSGRTADGLALLGRSLKLLPNQPDALSNVAIGLCSLNRPDEALDVLNRAIALKPDFSGAHYQRAMTLRNLGRLHDAVLSFDRAIALNAKFAEAYNERGATQRELHRHEAALADFTHAIAVRPNYADAHYHQGVVLQDLHRLEESISSYDRALEMNPGIAEAYNNRGRALRALNRPEKALASYEQAIALNPLFAEAFNNRGVALKVLRRLDEALASYERAIELQPGFADAEWNVALLHLLAGDFERGWKLYESRWALQPARGFVQPLWLGEPPIAGKTILIHAEQGLGDAIHFCRYIPLIERLNGRIVVEVPAALTSLMSTLKADVRIVERGGQLPEFDVHCPIMSLPLAFGTRLESIPSEIPYLFADADKVAAVRRMLGAKTRPRVGLVWSGASTHADDRNRSIGLASLSPILGLPIEFHSLQKEYSDADQASMRSFPHVRNHQNELADFSDTAALIAEMDLIVSVDTSVGHLAGALGKTVWILLPYAPDFRWLLDRSDSPWYPTATLFRQSAPGDWASAIRSVREHLVLMSTPDAAAVHVSRSLVLLQLNRLLEALASVEKALALGAQSPNVLTIRGLCLAGLERRPEALQSYDQAISSHPDYVPAHVNRGVILRNLKRPAEALSSFGTALSIHADNFEALVNRGLALMDVDRPREALADLERATALRPDHALAYVNQAAALVSLEQFGRALQAYDRAIALQPTYAQAHASRAAALAPLGRYEEILSSCDSAIVLAPTLVDAHFNRGAALRELGRYEAALASFRTAHACQPDHVDTNFDLGCLLLSQGHFNEGWRLYEWRNSVREAAKLRRLARPGWRGEESIAGKTLFAYADQGLGDTIQFCRYVNFAAERGARIILSAQSTLHWLLAGLGPTVELLNESDTPRAYDYHCALASFPGAFKTTPATIPAVVPYLFAQPERIAVWRQKISGDGFKIGISWHGFIGRKSAARWFPLRLLREISQIPSVRLISLQKVHGDEQLGTLPAGMTLETLGSEYDAGPHAFLDAAAVIASLDLVITCDTAIAHLAGALGRPTWVALKYSPDWRWMIGREDSPWYPTLRLFRQPRTGDWEAVFERMCELLTGTLTN